jgi:hypothetical protein
MPSATATQRALDDARRALDAPAGRRAALACAQRALCHARWLKVRDLWDIYPVQPAGGTPAASAGAYPALPPGALSPPPLARTQSASGSGGSGGGGGGGFDARLAAANGGAAAAALAVAGVPLEPSRVNATAQEPAQRERAAAALGYVAAAVALLEVILAVRARSR